MALRVAAILKFNGEWRFTSPGPIASEVSNDFYNLIGKVVAQGNRQRLLAHFMGSNRLALKAQIDLDLKRRR
jgi:hypothetical protein